MVNAMQTTVGRAGRVVIPKAIRDAMGLAPGRKVDLVYSDGKLEIEVATMRVHLEMRGSVPVIVPDEDVPAMPADLVRDVLEATRR